MFFFRSARQERPFSWSLGNDFRGQRGPCEVGHHGHQLQRRKRKAITTKTTKITPLWLKQFVELAPRQLFLIRRLRHSWRKCWLVKLSESSNSYSSKTSPKSQKNQFEKKSKTKIFTGVVFRPVGSTFQGLFRKKTYKFCNFDAVEKFDEQKTDDTFDGEMSVRKKPIFFPRVYKKKYFC